MNQEMEPKDLEESQMIAPPGELGRERNPDIGRGSHELNPKVQRKTYLW